QQGNGDQPDQPGSQACTADVSRRKDEQCRLELGLAIEGQQKLRDRVFLWIGGVAHDQLVAAHGRQLDGRGVVAARTGFRHGYLDPVTLGNVYDHQTVLDFLRRRWRVGRLGLAPREFRFVQQAELRADYGVLNR